MIHMQRDTPQEEIRNGKVSRQSRTCFGAGRGLGAVLANAFANEGAHLVVHYNSSSKGADETADAVRTLGRKALTVQGNICKWDDVKRVADEAYKEFGRVDILVNSAGDMALNQKSWRELDEDVVDHTLAVDVKGTIRAGWASAKFTGDVDSLKLSSSAFWRAILFAG